MQENHTTNNALADFCSMRAVLLVAVTMVLLAIVILLVPGRQTSGGWEELGMLAIFLQWLGLLSLAVLCMAKKALGRMQLVTSAMVTFLIIQAVTFALSELVYQLTLIEGMLEHLRPDKHGLFLLRNQAISIIISGVALRYMYMQEQLQRRIRAETQARIQALQARIRPHFLFNSMNTIASLTHIDATAAEKAIIDLSEIYRVTLQSDDTMTTLEEEINLARHYLEVESLRLHDRLRVNWDIDNTVLKTPIPRLILQPLVENAVYHGIETRPEGGDIGISVSHDESVRIEITNPLPERERDSIRQGNRMAIRNILDRLEIAYGSKASLTVEEADDRYTVCLQLPASGPEASL